MASPIVGGIIACWMQAFPRLSYQDAMEAIAATSRQPDSELSYPNNYYGYGEIDAYRGLLDILGVTAIKEVSQHEPHDARIWTDDGLLHIAFDQVPTQPVNVTIYTTGGARVFQTTISTRQSDVTLPLSTLNSGIYVVQLGTMGSALIRK